jgi:endonuclease G
VYDALFQPVDMPQGNLGDVQLELAEGIYQAAFRDERSWKKSQSVLLLSGQLVEIRQDIATSVPTVNTSDWSTPESSIKLSKAPEFIQSDAILELNSRSERKQLASQEGLFAADRISTTAVLMNWDALQHLEQATANVTVIYGRTGRSSNDEPSLLSTDRLTIVTQNGAEISSSLVTPGEIDSVGFNVPAGNYVLRSKTGLSGLELETPLYVSNGWRTQIVCSGREFQKGVTTPDLAKMVMRLSPITIELDHDPIYIAKSRQAESNALEFLSRSRPLRGKQLLTLVNEMTRRKSFNPMLGIYAGYLLAVSDHDDSAELLDKLLWHLENVLYRGPKGDLDAASDLHPDLTILHVRLRKFRGEDLAGITLGNPPLLRAGWEMLRKFSVSAPYLIPAGSLSDVIGGNLWGPSAWTIWKRPNEPVGRATLRSAIVAFDGAVMESIESNAPTSFDVAGKIAIIATALKHRSLRDWYRKAERTGAEAAVVQAICPIADEESSLSLESNRSLVVPLTGCPPSPWTLERLSQVANLPAGSARRALSSLTAAFLEASRNFGLDLQERSSMSRPSVIIPYDADFLGDGFNVPLPALGPPLQPLAYAQGIVLDYTHYSLVMQAARRVAIYTAHNVDAARMVRVPSGGPWKMDERAGEFQLGPEVYANNQLDRGHLVRRSDVLWGSVSEAREANKSTYFYTNAAPQHQNFNQDEWLSLEDWVLEEATEFSFRLCVFTGPVLRDNDPVLSDLPPNQRAAFRVHGPAQIPAAFWKIIVLRDSRAGGDDLSAVAFAMKQSEMWTDKDGSRLLNLKVHQVTISAIEEWTGLQFGTLRDVDELEWSEAHMRAAPGSAPAWPVVRDKSDITYSGISRRALGARARRASGGSNRSVSAADLSSMRRINADDCGCNSGAIFDAAAATEALNRKLVLLTDQLASLQREPPVGGNRSIIAEGAVSNDLDDAAEARVKAVFEVAPPALQPRVAEVMRQIVRQTEILKGKITSPKPSEFKRIVGGDLVPNGAFPSCCCIGGATDWFCTGVLIAPQVVLTAGHCGETIRRVMVGGNQVMPNLDAGARIIGVRRTIVHPQYRGFPRDENDINVLILDTPAGIPPAPLASSDQLRTATEVQLVGFGYNDPSLPLGFGTKRQVMAPLLPMKIDSSDDLGNLPSQLGFNAEYEFVAGRKGLGRDSCNGDSGGPAYLAVNGQFVLAGLTSRATRAAMVNCGDGGIYVRPDSFRQWIRDTVQAAGVSVFF